MYFPKDIIIKDVRSPQDILNDASKEWIVESEGILELHIRTSIVNSLDSIEVHAVNSLDSTKREHILNIYFITEYPYPVRIRNIICNTPLSFKEELGKSLTSGEIKAVISNLLLDQ